MRPLTIDDVDVQGRRVLLRTDYDVAAVADLRQDSRLRASLPTIFALRDRGARIAVCSHRGRPHGHRVAALSNRRLATHLGATLGTRVAWARDCVGPAAEAAVRALQPGDVLLLENVRFHAGEETNDDAFARQLAELADVYMNDAFSVVEHAHASVVGVPRYLPSAMGLALEVELARLAEVVNGLVRPLVLVIGGDRPQDVLPALERLLPVADTVCLVGVPANAVLRARGVEVGSSRVCDDGDRETQAAATRFTEAVASTRGAVDLVLPSDVVVVPSADGAARPRIVPVHLVRRDLRIVDIGPRTMRAVAKAVRQAGTAVWIGPAGVVERISSTAGTMALARAFAASRARTVVGGVQTLAAVDAAGGPGRIWHLTTGGVAFLRWLGGRALPGVEALVAARALQAPSGLREAGTAS